jgi:hypothetical protein
MQSLIGTASTFFKLTLLVAVKAVCGLAPEYSFLKLLMVAFIPVAGYFMAMKEPVEIV